MKSKIYTKKGDDGTTGLINGKRVYKDDIRLEVYGELDELNSCLGLLNSHIKPNIKYFREYDALLGLQSLLFNLGSQFACESEDRESYKLPRLMKEDIEFLENEIDRLDQKLPQLKNFILPGGGVISSICHICRGVCRRVERRFASFTRLYMSEVPPFSGEFLNRLSDYFFVLSRFFSYEEGNEEIVWSAKKEIT